jgi:hypothetical protein
MTRLRGRAPRGRRLHARAPFAKWHTQTFIAGLRADRRTHPAKAAVDDGRRFGDAHRF